jgi:predicted ATPase
MDRFIVISGCSGGGKSTLLSELKDRGYAVVEEPGRRIVAGELRNGSSAALPWINPAAFAERAVKLSVLDRDQAREIPGMVFFDRGLIDAASALEYVTGKPILEKYATERYNPRVFVTPPWPEIYKIDAERQHKFQDAVKEYERLLVAFSSLGYTIDVLPKVGVSQRADIILRNLGLEMTSKPSA